MNDSILFDTSTVRGFAEWLNHQVNGGPEGGGYAAQIDTIIAKLGGGAADESEGRSRDSDVEAQTLGTSGVAYSGKDYAAAETKNAQAALKFLEDMKRSLQGMADAAGVMSEDFSGEDGENAKDMQEQFDPGARG